MHFLGAGVETWVVTTLFRYKGGVQPFVFVSTWSTLPLPSGMVHIQLKKSISLEEGTFPLASTSFPMKNH